EHQALRQGHHAELRDPGRHAAGRLAVALDDRRRRGDQFGYVLIVCGSQNYARSGLADACRPARFLLRWASEVDSDTPGSSEAFPARFGRPFQGPWMHSRWLVYGLLLTVTAAAWGGWSWHRIRADQLELDQARREVSDGRYAVARHRLAVLAARRPGWGEVYYQL